METLRLSCHPDQPAAAVSAVECAVLGVDPHWLRLRWRVESADRVKVPPFAGRGTADGLWQRTCFELFLRSPGQGSYSEINLSPSERWAAYDFTSYREGMEPRAMARDCNCTLRRGGNLLIFDAAIPLGTLPAMPWQIAVAAVIEEDDGLRSYWALHHAEGRADFHNPACFTALLTAPVTA